MDARLASLAVLLACLALAGCDDDQEKTGAAKQSGSAAADSQEPTFRAANTGPKYFETPSHNIGCYVAKSAARCDIRERDWSPPPKTRLCKKIGLDYGQGIAVGKDHAEFVCAGDTALGGKATLGYGRTSQRGLFRCESELSGITCNNLENGAGFFLSRESYRIF